MIDDLMKEVKELEAGIKQLREDVEALKWDLTREIEELTEILLEELHRKDSK